MDRRERLLTLTMTLLHAPRPLSAEELRERVPGYAEIDQHASFRRAFERDKDALREMGVPISVAEVPGTDPPLDGYRIRRDQYYLDAPELAPDELAALRLAAAAVRVGDVEGTDALLRLGGLVYGGAPDDDAESEAVGEGPLVLPVPDGLETLFEAVGERRRVSFGYRGEQRSVDPHRLDFLRGHWYLSGFDHRRQAVRAFRVDRIVGSVSAGPSGQFAPVEDATAGVPAQPWRFEVDEPITAVLAVDADQAPWAAQELGDAASIRWLEDGSLRATVEVTNRAAFRSFVLSLLEHAEILEPAELRESIVAWLEQVA